MDNKLNSTLDSQYELFPSTGQNSFEEFAYNNIETFDLSSLKLDTITIDSSILNNMSSTGPYPPTNYPSIQPLNYPSIQPLNMPMINTLTNGTGPTYGINNIFNDTTNNGLHVFGDADFQGDIKIKGKSLIDSLEKIEERLAIFKPNEELESKWEKLRELRNQYIELEKDIKEKEQIWETLKK